MATTITLPYYSTDIPASLPTEAEIEAATDLTEAYTGRRVVEVKPHFVVKFGAAVDLTEGENMLFVREKTSIPVPHVYALYSKAGKQYIVMQRLAGHTLLSLWPQLDPQDKERIFSSLRAYFDELRALPSPGYYGSIGERRFLEGMFWTKKPDPAINGPFTSNDALLEAMALKYTYEGRSGYRADFYRLYLPVVLGGERRPVFSHGDFQRKNILVQKVVEDHDTADSCASTRWKVLILDWESAGWYPDWWEYSLATWALRYDDDWCLMIQKALDPYLAESSWMRAIRLELWS